MSREEKRQRFTLTIFLSVIIFAEDTKTIQFASGRNLVKSMLDVVNTISTINLSALGIERVMLNIFFLTYGINQRMGAYLSPYTGAQA